MRPRLSFLGSGLRLNTYPSPHSSLSGPYHQSSRNLSTQNSFGPLPRGTWDSHMHVVDPKRFSLAADAQYTPPAHTLQDAKSFYKQFGIQNMVLVQPSIYGNDNSYIFETLRELTPKHGRGVVGFDPVTMQKKTLGEWHELGVRGARVNLVSVGKEYEESELRKVLLQYAEKLRDLNWVLQLYIPLKMMVQLEKIVPDLGVKVCVDHFGSPTLPPLSDSSKKLDPYDLPGFESMINLLKGDMWVKLSAPYRISKGPELRDLQPLGQELIKQASNRLVFATDWPHTRFENVDVIPFIKMCHEWCDSEPGLSEKLFRTNAEELWDVRETD